MRTEEEVRSMLRAIQNNPSYEAAAAEVLLRWVVGETVEDAWAAIRARLREQPL